MSCFGFSDKITSRSLLTYEFCFGNSHVHFWALCQNMNMMLALDELDELRLRICFKWDRRLFGILWLIQVRVHISWEWYEWEICLKVVCDCSFFWILCTVPDSLPWDYLSSPFVKANEWPLLPYLSINSHQCDGNGSAILVFFILTIFTSCFLNRKAHFWNELRSMQRPLFISGFELLRRPFTF